jgi:glycosyltransferase involved in cell wall biosynthesis
MGIVYDKSLGKWTVKNANGVLAISNACKKFIKEKFINRDVEVIYRGIDIPTFSEKKE